MQSTSIPMRPQIFADQPTAKPCGFKPLAGIGLIGGGIGIARPDKPANAAAEPLHPAALLIHQNRGIPADDIPKFAGQRFDLRRIIDVALEQDQAPRGRLAQKSRLVGGDGLAG